MDELLLLRSLCLPCPLFLHSLFFFKTNSNFFSFLFSLFLFQNDLKGKKEGEERSVAEEDARYSVWYSSVRIPFVAVRIYNILGVIVN